MKKPTKGSYTKNPKYKVILPNGDIQILRGVTRENGSMIAEYEYFGFPKSAGKKALEKKQQEKMKKSSSSMKKSSSKKK
jgi:hypothetical protein